MKTKIGFFIIVFIVAITNLNAQYKTEAGSELSGLPGDNLDLYATLDLFQKSKTIEVSVDYLIGKTSLTLDKDALRRLEDISNLKEENKSFIYNLIDMALRDMKTKSAYAG